MSHDEIASRDALIKAAKYVFAHKGLDGATVKDICDRAGVNVSLVSYYFQCKEGLYRACIEQHGQARLNTAERILKAPDTVEEFKVRFRLYVEEHMCACFDDPELSMIIQREISNDLKVVKDIFKNTFVKGFEAFVEFLHAAKKKGLLKKEVDPFIFAGLIFGSVVQLVQNENMSKELFGVSLKDKKTFDQVMKQLELILEGALK